MPAKSTSFSKFSHVDRGGEPVAADSTYRCFRYSVFVLEVGVAHRSMIRTQLNPAQASASRRLTYYLPPLVSYLQFEIFP